MGVKPVTYIFKIDDNSNIKHRHEEHSHDVVTFVVTVKYWNTVTPSSNLYDGFLLKQLITCRVTLNATVNFAEYSHDLGFQP